ncbi:MAG: dethiobiotin synthase [Polyangia bacterium]
MTKRIFVSGTSTEIGKTVVARAVVAALRRRGIATLALKPVESGAPLVEGRLRPADAAALARACGLDPSSARNWLYAFGDPVSPHLAAARAGEKIDPEAVLDFLAQRERESDAEVVIAEGAGGLLVPLDDGLLFADLVARSGYELLIVSPDVLGTINATLLTIEAARSRGIPIDKVVLNRSGREELGNAEAIAAHGRVGILGGLPELPAAALEDDAELAELAERHLDLDRLIER